jgi:hypothetical protein
MEAGNSNNKFSSWLLYFLIITEIQTKFRDFVEANISIKPVDCIFALWRFRGNPWSLSLKNPVPILSSVCLS